MISIHALREEGDADLLNAPVVVGLISIHALREEGDYAPFGHGEVNGDFYNKALISIHALREEGDRRWPMQSLPLCGFLSTPSARRATRPRMHRWQRGY